MCHLGHVTLGLISLLVCHQVLAQAPLSHGYRQLAPGVVKVIPALPEERETYSGPRPLVDLLVRYPDLGWQPNFSPTSQTLKALGQEVTFHRSVWQLEFGFKPVRMITVDVTGPDGRTERKLVWYLVYYVKNPGQHLNPMPQTDARGHVTYQPQRVAHTVRFFPIFTLRSHDVGREYRDLVLPEAVEAIRKREDPNRTFYNSVNISGVTIPVSQEDEEPSVWGVATWHDIDPRTDFFSIYVQGLTNAYQWEVAENQVRPDQPPGRARSFHHKALQLNFWRPGDTIDPDEREIRYGVPSDRELPPEKTVDQVLTLYDLEERVDYRWVYR